MNRWTSPFKFAARWPQRTRRESSIATSSRKTSSRYPSAPRASLLRWVLDFAFRTQARQLRPAVSSLLSYGLVVHLLRLSTTHRCAAVAFGYRPESVCLERTCTSLNVRALSLNSRRLRLSHEA